MPGRLFITRQIIDCDGSVVFRPVSGGTINTQGSLVAPRSSYSAPAENLDAARATLSWSRYFVEVAALLKNDAIVLLIALIAIGIEESSPMKFDPYAGTYFGLWNTIFELCSAYGGVGLSLGYPNTFPSLSGRFQPFSKFVVILVMWYGYTMGLYPTSNTAFVLSPVLLGQPCVLSSGLTALVISGASPAADSTAVALTQLEAVLPSHGGNVDAQREGDAAQRQAVSISNRHQPESKKGIDSESEVPPSRASASGVELAPA